MATITHRGETIHTNGALPTVGSRAPDFTLTAADLSDHGLADYAGRRVVMNIVPSLDTPTCALSTKKFNEKAAALAGTTVLVISADLPFAQGRFCAAENLKNVTPLSLMRSRDFARDYGVLIEDGKLAGVTARAVVVLDGEGVVTHAQLVDEIAQEPDYAAALAALGG